MGALIMLGTLFGLIVLIFALVLRFDPEARGPRSGEGPTMSELTPLLKAAIGFAYVGGALFVAVGLFLSFRRGRPHPLLLVCISAISFSLDRGPLRLGGVRAVPARHPAHAVLVAAEHGRGAACRHRFRPATSPTSSFPP